MRRGLGYEKINRVRYSWKTHLYDVCDLRKTQYYVVIFCRKTHQLSKKC